MNKPGESQVMSKKFVDLKPGFLDFFAGSGLVSEGLKHYFDTIWANDNCIRKRNIYCANHNSDVFHLKSIEEVKGKELPPAMLSWGSFPCQDLSLAGKMAGIFSTRSGLVWHWLRIMDEMKQRPPIAVAENVVGLISSANGQHYKRLHAALVERGYKVGAVIVDASYWVPQSRKRVFVIAVDKNLPTKQFESDVPIWCHPKPIVKIAEKLDNWVWWNMPVPPARKQNLEHIVNFQAPVHGKEKNEKLLKLISPKHNFMLKNAVENGQMVFPGYKRTRNNRQVLELRFDGIAGCLRTPGGGSSRQWLVIKDKDLFKTRLFTTDELASLMGAPKGYKLTGSYNEGYKAMGDAVAVPVAQYLAKQLLLPLAKLVDRGDVNENRKIS